MLDLRGAPLVSVMQPAQHRYRDDPSRLWRLDPPGLGSIHERNHQGKGNLLLFSSGTAASPTQPSIIRCRERLGGLLNYYYSSAA